MKTLSDNPLELFNTIKDHLLQIEKLNLEILDETDISPTDWFKNLPSKLKNFLVRGKELLYQVEELLQIQETKVEPSEIKSIKKGKEDFSQNIIGFFKSAYEKDKKNESVKEEDRGFRSINEIYDNYEHLIIISRPTFYKHFKKLNVMLFLEKRKNPGLGGGEQFRYKAIEISSLIRTEKKLKKPEPLDSQEFRFEKVKIQEALINYKEKEYQKVINLIKNILENPSNELIQEKVLYTGCLFYIGCAFYKLKQFNKAFQYFEKINFIDRCLIDVRYYMVICKFSVIDYKYSLTNSVDLINIIENVINESELNINYDHARFDNFHYHDINKMNQEKIKENKLSKYFITLKAEPNPIHLNLRYYQDKIENPKFFIKSFKKTILDLRKLYGIIIKLCYLRFEVTRRIIFKYTIENKQLEIIKLLEELIDYQKKVEGSYHFIKDQFLVFRPYLAYFRNIFDLFTLEDLANKIKLEYPSLKENEFFLPNWLFKSTQRYIYFLNHINSYFRSVFQDRTLYIYTRREFRDNRLEIEIYNGNLIIESREKDLITEDFIVQAKIIEKYSLEKFIEEYNENYDIKIEDIEDFDKIIRKIERNYRPFYKDDKPIVYLSLIQNAIEYCKRNKLNKYVKYLQGLYDRTEIIFKKFNKIKNEFEKKIYLKTCEYWVTNYVQNQNIVKLPLKYNPEKSQLKWMVTDSVLKKIGDIIKENPKNYTFIIKLFDNQLSDEVIKIIEEFTYSFNYYRLYHFGIDKILSFKKIQDESLIKIGTNLFIDISDFKGSFEEKLDYIYYSILGVLRYGITELNIYVSEDNREKFLDYFSNQFSIDYKNDFLDFEVDECSENICFNLKLIKK